MPPGYICSSTWVNLLSPCWPIALFMYTACLITPRWSKAWAAEGLFGTTISRVKPAVIFGRALMTLTDTNCNTAWRFAVGAWDESSVRAACVLPFDFTVWITDRSGCLPEQPVQNPPRGLLRRVQDILRIILKSWCFYMSHLAVLWLS